MSLRSPLRRAVAALVLIAALGGCGGSGAAGGARSRARATARARGEGRAPDAAARGSARTGTAARGSSPTTAGAGRAAARTARVPQVLPAATAGGGGGFAPAVKVGGQVAVLVSRTSSGVTLLSFDQRLVELHLHSGTIDAGASGWRYGPLVAGAERRLLVAGFNGGFRLDTDAGGFQSYGHVAVPLRAGLGSVVTYADGYTDVGTWHAEVPAPGHGAVVSVRQNLTPLVDHGRAAASVDCVSCWGATLGGVPDPARSALGVTAGGRLVWAGGEHLTPAELAQALLGAGVVRAVELDINPEWVAGYLYRHPSETAMPVAIEMVAGAPGIPGQLLEPYSRDFFTVVAR
jgi:hypothetical protein